MSPNKKRENYPSSPLSRLTQWPQHSLGRRFLAAEKDSVACVGVNVCMNENVCVCFHLHIHECKKKPLPGWCKVSG